MGPLGGKVIVITGASSGIGLATARACSEAGMIVALAARRLDRLQDLASSINAQGGRAVAIAADVARPEDCERLIRESESTLGPIHAVFANAGYGFQMRFHETPRAMNEEIFRVNLWGSLDVVSAALPGMIHRRAGHVLFCSSCVGKVGLPWYSAYSATKAAQLSFARAMRHELRPMGIHVSSVHPIRTRTEFGDVVDAKSTTDDVFKRTPRFLIQPAQRVADAIVACLRRPRSEVWTSRPAQLAFGLMATFPGLADLILDRVSRSMPADPHPPARSSKTTA